MMKILSFVFLLQCGSRQGEEHSSGSSQTGSCSQQQGGVCHHQAGRLGELGTQGESMTTLALRRPVYIEMILNKKV